MEDLPMYAVANVIMFLKEKGIQEQQGEEIMARCNKLAHQNVISGGSVEDIFIDPILSAEFHEVVMQNPEHMKIGMEAIQSMQG